MMSDPLKTVVNSLCYVGDRIAFELSNMRPGHGFDIVLAVAQDKFKALGTDVMRRYGVADHVHYDLKNVFGTKESDLRL